MKWLMSAKVVWDKTIKIFLSCRSLKGSQENKDIWCHSYEN